MATENHTPDQQSVNVPETLFAHRLTPSSCLIEGEPFGDSDVYEGVAEYLRRVKALADAVACADRSELEPSEETISRVCEEIEAVAEDCQAVLDVWWQSPATRSRLKASAAEIRRKVSGEPQTDEDTEEREALLETIRDTTEEMGIAIHKALEYFDGLEEPGLPEFELRTLLRGADQLNDKVIGAASDLALGPDENEQEAQA